MDISELKSLTEKLVAEPESVKDLTEEQAIEVRKYLNPLGNVVSDDKTYANLSITNWTESYIKKFMMTSIIGYIYRLQTEYEPEAEIEYLRKQLEEKLKHADNKDIPKLRKQHEEYVKKLTSDTRGIIKKFLDRNFEYNPDNHVRKAKTENTADPERTLNVDAIKTACAVASKAPTIESKLRDKQEQTYSYLRDNFLTAYQSTVQASAEVKKALTVLMDPMLSSEDKHGILLKKYKTINAISNDMKKIAEPLSTADIIAAWTVDPPIDVFHQLNRYTTNHYEQIRDVCQALYNEKPDMEYSIIFYKAFDNPEDAATHRNQYESDFKAEVITVENAGVTLLGPFKENRSRVAFYNKNTEVMKKMMEQVEADHKLGKDLMEKRIKKEKKKNIQQEGPDAPGLHAYSKAVNTVQDLGAKKILTKEEQEKLAAATALKEDAEVPDDAIQVNMFFPQEDADGNSSLKRGLFYTQAEAPLHLQEGSEYTDNYQPARAEGQSVKEAYKTKTITSSNGEKKEIKVPVKK